MLTLNIKNLFPHKHKFEQVGVVYHPSEKNFLSACPMTARVYRCKCGEERRELTPAGLQQIHDWGDDPREVLGEL
jgi:2-C-methyl-D-erythritol 4-phosphate cytidylyltransferase